MPQPDFWKSLIDGTFFAGWWGVDGGAIPEGWRIVDGAITALAQKPDSPRSNYLVTLNTNGTSW